MEGKLISSLKLDIPSPKPTENHTLRIKTIEDILKDETISKAEKESVLKCYKYVSRSFNSSGIEPLNGNTMVTIDGQYHCIKIHIDRTISHVQQMKGSREDYYKIQLKE
tara:strand:+ start:901 stop:1227 length:327 start_codon:yes stop_codon:yes gene_type:complete